jgi:TRAP-type C4-dicarboxylate transport system substrate-binding protein
MRTFAALAAAALLVLPISAAAQAPPNVVKLATLVPDGSVWDKALKGMGAEWTAATQ